MRGPNPLSVNTFAFVEVATMVKELFSWATNEVVPTNMADTGEKRMLAPAMEVSRPEDPSDKVVEVAKTACAAWKEDAKVGSVEVAEPEVWVKEAALKLWATESFPLKMASPVTLMPPVVILRAATSRPPANEEVPEVVTSKAPETLSPVAASVVVRRAGSVDVADDVTVNLPDERISPVVTPVVLS